VDLGTIGVWSGQLQRAPLDVAGALVAEWEALGYRAVWVPESPSARDVLTFSAVLLERSSRIVVATGIAVIWNRDPVAMSNASRTMAEAHPNRFVLGVGVSHRDSVDGRGHRYERPLAAMRRYLTDMDAAPYDAPEPQHPSLRLVAALGPRMTEVGAELADGVHPFLGTPDHTATAREIVGSDGIVAVEQAVLLTGDGSVARAAARQHLERFLKWPNYHRHLHRLGFTEEELAGGGSDRVVDALYAWGDEAAVRERVGEHIAAGADHVCLQAIPRDGMDEATTVRALAPALLNPPLGGRRRGR